MECPNCTFQNTPGLKACVRCRGLLDFSGVAIEPPRASEGRLSRRWRGMRRSAGHQIGGAVADAARAVRIPLRVGISWNDLLWSILPGMAQVRRGVRVLGWPLFVAWLGLLIGAVVIVGSPFATFLALSAISVHCLAVSLLFNSTLAGLPVVKRAGAGLLIYASIVSVIYAPAYLAFSGVARVLEVRGVRSGPVITNGDTILYTGRWIRPAAFKRGDLVVYDIDRARTGGAIITAGLGVERVLGVPGDHVRFDTTGVWVNGVEQVPELWPLGGVGRLPSLSLTAGPGEYIILPSALRWTTQGNVQGVVAQIMDRVARVRDDHVRGRVVWRIRPWARAGVPAAEPTP